MQTYRRNLVPSSPALPKNHSSQVGQKRLVLLRPAGNTILVNFSRTRSLIGGKLSLEKLDRAAHQTSLVNPPPVALLTEFPFFCRRETGGLAR